MDRRSFLKSVAAAYAALYLPSTETTSFLPQSSIDLRQQYGNSILYNDSNAAEEVAKLLAENARQELPKGVPFRIVDRESQELLEDFRVMFWHYNPKGYSPEDIVLTA